MLKAIVLAGALALASPSIAQPAGPDTVTNSFFGLVRSGEITKAYDGLGRGTVLDQKKLELQNVANQTARALQIYGKVIDWELMTDKKLSESYLIRNYMVRTERPDVLQPAPLPWRAGLDDHQHLFHRHPEEPAGRRLGAID